jgi:gliding motility-associated-like protein
LNTTGAQTYVWNASSTLSNVNIPNPVATPTTNTQYIVTGTNVNGCVAKDTVNINVHTRPTITVTDDAQICRNATIQLSATGGLSYLWTPPATLDNPTSATPIATPTADTWYYVDVTDNNTCTWRDSVLVTLRPEPVFTLTPASTQICTGQSVQLLAGGGTSYSWSPSTGMSDPTVPNPTVTPTGTTTYTVVISEGVCNRSQSFSTTVTVERPVVVTTDNTTICKGTSVQFNTTGAQNYSWNQPGTLNSPSIPDPIATPAVPTQYIVTGTTATGCTAKDTVNIDFHPDPLITTTDDADICRNASIQLSTTGGGSYAWTPAATLSNPSIANPVATPAVNTMYYVDITDANNCVHRDSVKVNIRPDAVFSLDAAAPVCLGNTVQLNASGGDTYSWQASPTLSNTGIPNPVAAPGVTETYFVTISESFCGHSETLSTTVRVNPLPTIQINKSNDIDCSYDRAQLSATGGVRYVWAPAGTLSSATIANPVATPTSTTDYTVSATDANGCVNSGTVTVKVEAINEGKYLMANGFTPNGDGLNDCYGVKLWGIIQEIEFSIYNRWGERIFYSTQPSACWDGTYKGIKQDSGVFVYMIKAKTSCAPSVFRKGTFVLIR